MNDIRNSYVKVLPWVLLAGLLVIGLQIVRFFIYDPNTHWEDLWWLDLIISIVKFGAIWAGIGLAFRQLKPAAIAMGVALLLLVCDHFVFRYGIAKDSVAFSHLYALLFNVYSLPFLVFGFICFKEQGIRYFVPLWLLSYATRMAFVGSSYLDTSPYNFWYRLLHVDDLLRVQTGEHSYRSVNILAYFHTLALMTGMVIIIGECYAAATANKKWKQLFHIDLSTQYTNAGALVLFYSLRVLINVLVIGLLTFPIAHFVEKSRIYYEGQSLFSFLLVMIGGTGLLIGIVLYYRRFLVEFFIGRQRKMQGLFWAVNLPIAGMFVFPFAIPAKGALTSTEDRTRFYFTNAMYNLQPYNIMGVILVLSLIGAIAGSFSNYDNSTYWLLWVVEAALLVWYVTSFTGFYVIIGIGITGLILFFCKLAINERSIMQGSNILLWYAAAFNVVQYTVLLPVFHLNEMKIVQEPYQEDELLPIEELVS